MNTLSLDKCQNSWPCVTLLLTFISMDNLKYKSFPEKWRDGTGPVPRKPGSPVSIPSFFLSFFLSLLLSFSGWSLGAQGPYVFTYLPVLLRPEWEGTLRLHSLGRPGGWLRPMWMVQVPCLGVLLAFCVNQGISASFLSSSLLTANSFLISLYIYISLSPHCSCFRYHGSNWGWTLVCNLKNNTMNLFTK